MFKYHKLMCECPTPHSYMGWNYYLCGSQTISHIYMLKLIERDAGDEEREQRQLFVTSFYLTGIIRYMKLKFLTGGSCWQHYFLFHLSPPFSFVFLFMLIWTQCFKKHHPPLLMALQFHSLHSEEQPVRLFNPLLPVTQELSEVISIFLIKIYSCHCLCNTLCSSKGFNIK